MGGQQDDDAKRGSHEKVRVQRDGAKGDRPADLKREKESMDRSRFEVQEAPPTKDSGKWPKPSPHAILEIWRKDAIVA